MSNRPLNSYSNLKTQNKYGIYGAEEQNSNAGETFWIVLDSGDETVQGTVGNDTIVSNGNGSSIDGGDGNDVMFLDDNEDTILGGKGNDTILASSQDTFVDAGAGDDSITGVDGDGTLSGGSGNDTIRAVTGGAYDFVVYGGRGDDMLIRSGDGQYKTEFRFAMYNYGMSKDVGWSGSLDRNNRPDDLNATLTCGTDTIVGFVKGVDKLKFEKNFGDLGFEGTLDFSYVNGDTIITWRVGQQVMAIIKVLGVQVTESDVSYLNAVRRGTSSDDSITGTVKDDRIKSGRGNDTISIGLGGHDTVFGDSGHDLIIGESESSEFYGGSGNDTMSVIGLDNYVSGGSGNDQIYVSGNKDNNVYGDRGNDVIQVENSLGGGIFGGLGNDVISFSGSGLSVYDGGGNDTIYNSGKENGPECNVFFGAGNDVLYAGKSRLTFTYDMKTKNDDDDYVNRNFGKDVIYGFKRGIDKLDVLGDIDNPDQNLSVSFKPGKDAGSTLVILFMDGQKIGQVLVYTTDGEPVALADMTGTNGISYWEGEKPGDKVLSAEKGGTYNLKDGDDIVYYTGTDRASFNLGGGNDEFDQSDSDYAFVIVNGGQGDDTISFSSSNIKLTGGTGRDVFIADFALDSTAPLITDFEVGTDTLLFNAARILDFETMGLQLSLSYDKDSNTTRLTTGDDSLLMRFTGDYTRTSILDDIVLKNNKLFYVGPNVEAGVGVVRSQLVTGFDISEQTFNMTGSALAFAGGGGHDTLIAGIEGDTINGDVGNDALVSGRGNDLLDGGTGRDTYVFDPDFGHDHIASFNIKEDKLWFSDTLVKNMQELVAAIGVNNGHAQITLGSNIIEFDNVLISTAAQLNNFKSYIASTTTLKSTSDFFG